MPALTLQVQVRLLLLRAGNVGSILLLCNLHEAKKLFVYTGLVRKKVQIIDNVADAILRRRKCPQVQHEICADCPPVALHR